MTAARPLRQPAGRQGLRVLRGRQARVRPAMAPWAIVVLIGVVAFLGLGFARTSLDKSAFELDRLNRAIADLEKVARQRESAPAAALEALYFLARARIAERNFLAAANPEAAAAAVKLAESAFRSAAELAPLKLDAARFRTTVTEQPEERWGPQGIDTVEFLISTNPGADFAPLGKIASGGELSRFILALKVALAEEGGAATVIFDEIDRGVGGAVASAIGERLARLASSGQLLAVTHSPQVAARGDDGKATSHRNDGCQF